MIAMLNRFQRGLGKVELAFGILCMAVVVISTSLGVVYRYILQSPLTWTNDAGGIALVWMTFIGAAAVHKEGGHVAITGLVKMFPRRWNLLVALASALVVGLSVVVIGWYAVIAAQVQWPQEIVALRISRGFYSVPIVWAAVSMTLTTLVAALKAASDLAGDVWKSGKA
ncbi:MAG: TRAP transporter small permease [Rhodocyclaceae bacterium]|nr:TRAP transporter small permease [Rhodocyclaceae bacterium]